MVPQGAGYIAAAVCHVDVKRRISHAKHLTSICPCGMMALQSKGCWRMPAEIQRIAAVIPRT